ncbi:MAG: efflux transporter periplasmic adaptor subunit [Tistrella sp.]|nr:efflux RND transporter periplasmic adaptor subunit [Tistrella sp.]MAD36181.1 efflux transporter periplasmic adaptor subunit [Tistrella sp.]MBA75301.1 efflux transporter periplasmic adaptor subunit [Tistrella sp.]
MRARGWITLVIVAGLAGAAGWAWQAGLVPGVPAPGATKGPAVAGTAATPPQQPPAAPAMKVGVAKAGRGTAYDRLITFGTVEPVARIVLSPQSGGHVVAVLFREGEAVKQGQPLVRLDQRVAEAELASARATAALDAQNLKRDEELGRRGTKSRADIDQSRAAVAASRAALEVKQTQLDLLTLRAPIDGVAGTRKIEVGSFLSPGEEALTVEDRSRLRVTFRVSEKLLPRLKTGLPVTLSSQSLGPDPIQGRVTLVDPSIEPDSRSILLRAELTQAEIGGRPIHPGLFVNVDLLLDSREGAVLVPRPAVMSSLSGDYVYVADNGKAVRRPVTIGAEGDGGTVEIVTGLDAGTPVIVEGQFKVEDGMRIDPVPAGGGG